MRQDRLCEVGSIPRLVIADNKCHYDVRILQLAKWCFLIHDRRGRRAPQEPAASNRGRPRQVSDSNQGGDAVDALQATLGDVLLVLAGLAVVLLAVILVLAEAHLILHLARKLTKNLSEEQGGR
jgi:hypothetical protein